MILSRPEASSPIVTVSGIRAVVFHSRLSSSFPRLLPKKDNPRTNFFAVRALPNSASSEFHFNVSVSTCSCPLRLALSMSHPWPIKSTTAPLDLDLDLDLDENQDCFQSPQFNFQGPERQSRATLSLM